MSAELRRRVDDLAKGARAADDRIARRLQAMWAGCASVSLATATGIPPQCPFRDDEADLVVHWREGLAGPRHVNGRRIKAARGSFVAYSAPKDFEEVADDE